MTRPAMFLAVALAVPLLQARAEEGTYLPPVTDQTVAKECGACHMVFPPQFLPARSWQKLMADLSSHFGEDASLADPARQTIMAYLVDHAADGPQTRDGKRFLRGLSAADTPQRISAHAVLAASAQRALRRSVHQRIGQVAGQLHRLSQDRRPRRVHRARVRRTSYAVVIGNKRYPATQRASVGSARPRIPLARRSASSSGRASSPRPRATTRTSSLAGATPRSRCRPRRSKVCTRTTSSWRRSSTVCRRTSAGLDSARARTCGSCHRLQAAEAHREELPA